VTVQRVVITRSGGFANISVTTEVDDPGEAARITEAVRGAAERPPGRARDDFVYVFTIETTVGTDSVELTGAQLPGELRPTVRSLLDRGRPT
jgi:hypothetical protein